MISIDPKDMELFTAFIKREKLDFKRVNEGWSEYRIEKILEALSSYSGKADNLFLLSYSNVGTIMRHLMIPVGKGESWERDKHITVNLCTCGKNHCWGTITFPDGTSTGQMGVQPLGF